MITNTQASVDNRVSSKNELIITLTRSMDKSLAKIFTTESGVKVVSTNFSFCIAMLTQAHVTVEGKNPENLQSGNQTEEDYLF